MLIALINPYSRFPLQAAARVAFQIKRITHQQVSPAEASAQAGFPLQSGLVMK